MKKITYFKNLNNRQKTFIFIGILLIIIFIILITKNIMSPKINNSSNDNFNLSPDLKIETIFIEDDYGYFNVKNIGDKVIQDFTLTYIGYDTNGNLIKLGYETTYDSKTFQTANILPNEIFGLDNDIYIGNSSVKYLTAIISDITFKDGSTWKTNNIDSWANTSNNFSIEEHKQKIENFKTDAILAEENEYLKITNIKKYNDNRFSYEDDLDVTVENIGDKTIKKYSLIIMQYDNNGYKINSFSSHILKNAVFANCDSANLETGKSGTWNWSLFFEKDCNEYKALIYKIEFKDGSTWINENTMKWMLYNEDKR